VHWMTPHNWHNFLRCHGPLDFIADHGRLAGCWGCPDAAPRLSGILGLQS
jgi:hypothetical protein